MFAIYRYCMYTHKWLVKTLVKERVGLGIQVARQSTARPRGCVRVKKKKNICEAQPGHVAPLMASKREERMLEQKWL